MKKKLFYSLIIVVLVLGLVGCSSNEDNLKKINEQEEKETIKNKEIEGNTRVGYLKFYVPSDYTYRPDLRGLMYEENQKKVYIKGDYDNNPNNAISLVVYLETVNKDVKEYVDSINKKLSEEDTIYTLRSNGKMNEIYIRENYIIDGTVNYAYIVGKSGDIYVANIRGPQEKAVEISIVSQNLFKSLYLS